MYPCKCVCVCVCACVSVCVSRWVWCACPYIIQECTCIHVHVPSRENFSLCITLVAGGIDGFFDAVDGARCELDEKDFLELALADPGGDWTQEAGTLPVTKPSGNFWRSTLRPTYMQEDGINYMYHSITSHFYHLQCTIMYLWRMYMYVYVNTYLEASSVHCYC